MHARPIRSARAPQSRDRLYLAYWSQRIGRDPDWDRWLRPQAYCPACDRTVQAMQVFKDPRMVMGRYGANGQYVYRCPSSTCRHQMIEPAVLPASVAVDLTLSPGPKIGERVDAAGNPKPPKAATLKRITYGLTALAGKDSHDGQGRRALAGQTRRGAKTGAFLVSYYRSGRAYPLTKPVGTLTTRDRYAVIGLGPGDLPAIEDCTLRMLTPDEIARGMAFNHTYCVTGTKRQRVAGYGNAVTPPVAEILGRALVTCITGQAIPHEEQPLGPPSLAPAE